MLFENSLFLKTDAVLLMEAVLFVLMEIRNCVLKIVLLWKMKGLRVVP